MKSKNEIKNKVILKEHHVKNLKHGYEFSDAFYKIVSDNIPISIITIDKEGYITSVNKYFRTFSSIKDYHNHNIFTDPFFIKENLVDEYKKLLKFGTPFRRDNCHEVNSDGEDKYFRIKAAPILGENGEIEGAVSLASDNTEAIVLKNQLIEANSNLEQKVKNRTEELNRAIELKSIFMADVSHEFRTSLTIMQCSVELLSKTADIKKEDSDLFGNVLTEIKRVSSMLADLTLLTKSDSADSKLHYKKMDVNQSISSICKELRVVASKKGIVIEFMEDGKPAEIFASKDDIEKLLLNLIRNAIKYNKENGWIKVWSEVVEGNVCIKVEDGGIGIPEKDLPNIFERFYMVDKARTRNGDDTGLGLAICKHIVEVHGGKIKVESKLGQGTTFSVCLPAYSGN